ncbi:MAG: hypothetical protein P1U44_02165 [Vicingaceae bacterium]|nr:hypothetical protein [Vicingaceae bacterium]
MKINIVNLHHSIQYKFEDNIVLYELLMNLVNEPEFFYEEKGEWDDLILSISCNRDVQNDILLGEQMKSVKNKELTQVVYFPNIKLTFQEGYVFNEDIFDFIYTKSMFQVYPVEDFITYFFKSIKLIGKEMHIIVNEKTLLQLEKKALELYKKDYTKFRIKSEEEYFLEYLKSKEGKKWMDEDGEEWKKSEIGKKWRKLLKKYIINGSILIEKIKNYE